MSKHMRMHPQKSQDASSIYNDIKDYCKQIVYPTQETTMHEYKVSKDAHIHIDNVYGDINLTTWNEPKVIINVTKQGTDKQRAATQVSLKNDSSHYIFSPQTQSHEDICTVTYDIVAPESAVYTFTTQYGSIRAQDTKSACHCHVKQSGNIHLKNIQSTLVATNTKGNTYLEQSLLHVPDTIFIDHISGNIDIMLHKNIHADIKAHAHKGKITSEQMITIDPYKTILNRSYWHQVQKYVKGSIGAGGSSIVAESKKGYIAFRSY
jgi:hypothetical protein